MKKLSDKALKALAIENKQYKKSLENGLYILVHPNGSKYFRFKYYIDGKEKHLAIGVYPKTTLEDARIKAAELKKELKDNIDPSQKKKLDKLVRKINTENNFEAVAREWHQNNISRWTKKHGDNILRRLESDMVLVIMTRYFLKFV
jgi:uncharacterized protein YfeS